MGEAVAISEDYSGCGNARRFTPPGYNRPSILNRSSHTRSSMRPTLLAVIFSLCCTVHAQLDQILRKADETLNQRNTSGLSNDKIIAGLKQALQVSTGEAVAVTGKRDGCLKNEAIRILLSPKL